MFKPFLKQMPANGLSKDHQPQTEVTPKAKRRRFSAQYKLRILEEADQGTQPGEIGALLRREGLYSSNLTTWRRQREQGQLGALSPKKRGPKPKPDADMARELATLRKQNARLEQQLKKAELIIEVQKKVSLLLGLDINTENEAI
jgi:transposase-like protein